MTWGEFLQYLEKYADELENPPPLTMAGVVGDNATRYLLDQKGVKLDCTNEALLKDSKRECKDFVWPGGVKVRVMGTFETGGHPALAGFGDVCCAGVIDKGMFKFHSGHYHPKATNAIPFLLVFVRESCKGLEGLAREELVHELCSAEHVLYLDNSDKITYSASLATLLGRPRLMIQATSSSSSPSSFSSASSSMPIPIGGSRNTPSRPIAITSSRPVPIVKHAPTIATTSTTSTTSTSSTIASSGLGITLSQGISPTGQHLRRKSSGGGRPIWTPDSEVSKCQDCRKEFNTFRRKHHCRQCGGIFCDACSKHTKELRHPAQDDGKEEKGKLRVCNTCFKKVDFFG